MVVIKGHPPAKDKMEEREKAFEAKYRQDEEIVFKAAMRRAKLAGRMAAGRLGLTAGASDDFVREMIDAAFSDPSPRAIVARMRPAFEAHGLAFEPEQLLAEVERLGHEAHRQILAEMA